MNRKAIAIRDRRASMKGAAVSASKQAKAQETVARRRYVRVRDCHRDRLKALEGEVATRVEVQSMIVAPALDRFVEVFSMFTDLEFAKQSSSDAPIVGAVEGPRLREVEAATRATVTAVSFGGVGGGLAAVGTYATVAQLGTASTGTAIATLNGVAASNATLAAIGGGSLASGGGGVALGTAVLGGVVVAPAVVVGGLVCWQRRKKALAQTQTNVAELNAATAKLEADRARIARLRVRVQRLTVLSEQLMEALGPRVEQANRWARRSRRVSSHGPQRQAHLARTTAMAECMYLAATVPIWTEKGNATRRSDEAIAAAEAMLKVKA